MVPWVKIKTSRKSETAAKENLAENRARSKGKGLLRRLGTRREKPKTMADGRGDRGRQATSKGYVGRGDAPYRGKPSKK